MPVPFVVKLRIWNEARALTTDVCIKNIAQPEAADVTIPFIEPIFGIGKIIFLDALLNDATNCHVVVWVTRILDGFRNIAGRRVVVTTD